MMSSDVARAPDPYLIDAENPELADEDITTMRPASEMLPPALYADLAASEPKSKRRPGQRGPGKRPAKVSVTLRLDPVAVAAWKGSGSGWQRRVNDMLVREAPKVRKAG